MKCSLKIIGLRVEQRGAMATDTWYCPHCSATPIDIHPAAYWKDEAA